MRRKRLDRMQCSIARALDVVGDPWTLLLVRDALLGVTRFEAFQARLQIPRATLTARLEHLVSAGILERRSYQEHPPREAYVPTAKGRGLRPVIVTLMQWGDEFARDDPPPTVLEDAATGLPIEPVLVDRVSGAPLTALRVRAVGPVVPRRG
ncbi:helix-turn-helix domain-containing protein [Nannocystis pusilla]|uniref:Helix-turn-helix domain-containing protein n=1 Tax=Nannocystis pusilla TaxID=889268 RepID=A0A9X3EQU0_9BACT|nr:helix-turn-helix domain-containing protein [Nannocystis pusilla]